MAKKMSEEGELLLARTQNDRSCLEEAMSSIKGNAALIEVRASKQDQVATADATDPAETMALVNELKALLNLMNS